MTTRTFHLMGPYTGHVIDMADADAATGAANGWSRSIVATPPHGFDSSGQLPMAKWPATLKAWLLKTWGYLPEVVNIPVLAISKANPTVITISTTAIAALNNGDSVAFAGTGTALDAAGPLVVSAKNAGAGTFTVPVDLSAIPAPVTNTGTVTKV